MIRNSQKILPFSIFWANRLVIRVGETAPKVTLLQLMHLDVAWRFQRSVDEKWFGGDETDGQTVGVFDGFWYEQF